MTAPYSVLHVAALPFPGHQGTQAAISQMLSALVHDGRHHELLCYAHAGYEADLSFTVRRAHEAWPYRSLRSGPNMHKLLADACLARAFARERRSLMPALVVAHHVEAAALTGTARRQIFFAHTDVGAELPSYANPAFHGVLAAAGGRLDRALVRHASAVASISPWLAQRMQALCDTDKVRYVPAPWPLPAPMTVEERAASRMRLGLASDARVLLYAGNLDHYQGWEEVVGATALLAASQPRLVLLVGTLSDAAPLRRSAQQAGVGSRLRVHPIDNDEARRCLHAAADVLVVPRRTAGGLPMKLLDGMSRGIACVVTPTASAGLPVLHAVIGSAGDDAAAIAASISLLDAEPEHATRLAARARAYVAEHHNARRFLQAFDDVSRLAFAG
jgi:glycosyltransferase involved in cell wall biosynthesis